MTIQTLYSASLTSVGVGLKLVLKYSEDPKYLKKYAPLLNVSCAVSLLLLSASRLCHSGWAEFSSTARGEATCKAAIWLLYVVVAAALAGVGFVAMGAPATVSLNVAAVAISFLLQVLERRRFGDTVHVGHGHTHPDGASTTTDSSTDEFLDGFLNSLEGVASGGTQEDTAVSKKDDCDASGVPFCQSWNACAKLSVDRRIELAESYLAVLRSRKLKYQGQSVDDGDTTPELTAVKEDDAENQVVIC